MARLAEEFHNVAAELRRRADEASDPIQCADEDAGAWRILADGLAALDLSPLNALSRPAR